MAEITVFRARNTTGLAINGERVTKVKPYGLIQTIQKFEVDDEEIRKAIPAADVQPVSYGRWIDIYEWAKMHDSTPSGMCLYYWCSECQKEQEKKSNFCPNCGAKMIEGGNENDTL